MHWRLVNFKIEIKYLTFSQQVKQSKNLTAAARDLKDDEEEGKGGKPTTPKLVKRASGRGANTPKSAAKSSDEGVWSCFRSILFH